MKFLHLFVAISSICLSTFAQPSTNSSNLINLINPLEVYTFNKKLATEFNGRLTGDSGYTESAKWVASNFKSWKLKPYDNTGYLQPFPISYTIIEESKMALILPAKSDTSKEQITDLKLNEDFLPLLYSDNGNRTAELAFVGWGISAPELNYDDYKNLDVNGKFVLCFRGTPKKDTAYSHYDEHRTRMYTAKTKGAKGLFYIYEEPIASPNGDLLTNFTPATISSKVSDILLAEKGWQTKKLYDFLTTTKESNSFLLSAKITYIVKSKHYPDGIGYNVIGKIDGNDISLSNECVVVGAHLDHCGTHMGLTFAGANDNASGSAVVMEIAKVLSTSQVLTKRAIVFVLFGGEEKGLIGSKYFVKNLPKQFSKIKAMINFDMVGEGDGTWCEYSAEPEWVKSALDNANNIVKTIKSSRVIKEIGVSTSDFATFYKEGIPCITFASNGPHLHYHQTGDVIYRINPDILADIARIGLLCAIYIANL